MDVDVNTADDQDDGVLVSGIKILSIPISSVIECLRESYTSTCSNATAAEEVAEKLVMEMNYWRSERRGNRIA